MHHTLLVPQKRGGGSPKAPCATPGFAALPGGCFPCSLRSSTRFIIRTANFSCVSQTAFASPRAEMRSPMAETSLLLLDTSHGVGCRVVRHYHNPPGCQHKSLQRQQPWPVLKRHPQRHILCSGWRISEPFAKISGVRLRAGSQSPGLCCWQHSWGAWVEVGGSQQSPKQGFCRQLSPKCCQAGGRMLPPVGQCSPAGCSVPQKLHPGVFDLHQGALRTPFW